MSSASSLSFPASAIPKTFAADLAVRRAQRGWSQLRLADEADLKRETIVRLESGRRRPVPDTVFRIEAALDLEAGTFVPGWPQWSPIGSTSPGARSRDRRRSLGLSLDDVAEAAGVSAATMSRFECETLPTPALALIEIREGLVEILALRSDGYARILGFPNAAAHLAWCVKGT